MAMRDEIERGMEIEGELRKTAANFLLIELEASLTFAEAALSAVNNVAKRERDRANARKGYDTLLRFSRQFNVPPSAEQYFADKLRHLKSVLEVLGETRL